MKLTEVKPGMVLVADGGFPCLLNQQRCEVRADGDGLYIECNEGRHYLIGQIDFNTGTELIGLSRLIS